MLKHININLTFQEKSFVSLSNFKQFYIVL